MCFSIVAWSTGKAATLIDSVHACEYLSSTQLKTNDFKSITAQVHWPT